MALCNTVVECQQRSGVFRHAMVGPGGEVVLSDSEGILRAPRILHSTLLNDSV